jgi:hypothetical protein
MRYQIQCLTENGWQAFTTAEQRIGALKWLLWLDREGMAGRILCDGRVVTDWS